MKTPKAPLIILSALILSSCMTTDFGSKQTVGTLVGAGLGGLVGSQIGKGSGQLAATAAGTLLGGALGNVAGQSLDRADAVYRERAYSEALESAPAGSAVPWANPDSGTTGYVEPTSTYQSESGTYCREFRDVITINGRKEEAYGQACRRPDGSWQIQT